MQTLRERNSAATRDGILDIAMERVRKGSDVSHESIAREAGIGARTAYRYFPDRASLLQALWHRLRDETNTRFPTRAEDIVPFARAVFAEFDKNEQLIRTVLNSTAGTEVRERGGPEGRAAFSSSLIEILAKRPVEEQRRIIGVFLAIYSAPFWQLLRDRAALSGAEAQDAVAWVLETLVQTLKREENK